MSLIGIFSLLKRRSLCLFDMGENVRLRLWTDDYQRKEEQ